MANPTGGYQFIPGVALRRASVDLTGPEDLGGANYRQNARIVFGLFRCSGGPSGKES